MPPDSSTPQFWESRYRESRTAWDYGGVPPALSRFLEGEKHPGRVLLPGCGSGYEIIAFAQVGWEVVALDFSQAAVERARGVAEKWQDCVMWGDFFSFAFDRPFDLVYERTFLCSMPLKRRPAYARRMAWLIRPGGRLAGLFYYDQERPLDPPFPITSEKAAALLPPHFELSDDQAIPAHESQEMFAGHERWQVWRRK